MFGVYGFGMFVVSPFVIGADNRLCRQLQDTDIGARRTAQVVAAATAIGAIGLVAAALEGIVCIVLAAPLALGVALIGGMLGRSIAVAIAASDRAGAIGLRLAADRVRAGKRSASDRRISTRTRPSRSTAPPELVWKSILHMDTMDEPLALPFRLGVAYPLRGEVVGEGVGAVRHGEFSTGIAIERVTEWVPNRKLAFVVVNDVPSMRELSPYQHVHAPHAVGYFRTSYTSFELVPRPGGGTESRRTHVAPAQARAGALLAADGAVDRGREQRACAGPYPAPGRTRIQ